MKTKSTARNGWRNRRKMAAPQDPTSLNQWLKFAFPEIFYDEHLGINALRGFLSAYEIDMSKMVSGLTKDQALQIRRRADDVATCWAICKNPRLYSWQKPLISERNYRKICRKNARIVHIILATASAQARDE